MSDDYTDDAMISQQQAFDEVTSMQLRLDTDKIMEKIEVFLKGKRIIRYQEDGKFKIKIERLGIPKANAEGIQDLLLKVNNIVNPQTVSGNFVNYSNYEDYIEEVNVNLASDIFTHVDSWKMAEEDMDQVCDFIMELIIPFMTRLLFNLERTSYPEGKVVEKNTVVHELGGQTSAP